MIPIVFQSQRNKAESRLTEKLKFQQKLKCYTFAQNIHLDAFVTSSDHLDAFIWMHSSRSSDHENASSLIKVHPSMTARQPKLFAISSLSEKL